MEETPSGDETSQLKTVTKKCEDSIMAESVDTVTVIMAVVASMEKSSNEGEDNRVASVVGPLQLSEEEKCNSRVAR